MCAGDKSNRLTQHKERLILKLLGAQQHVEEKDEREATSKAVFSKGKMKGVIREERG